MAKKSAVKTPKTPARHPDDYSESEDEEEVDDTMVHSPQIQHLASDLPDPDPSSPEKAPRPTAQVEIRRSSTRATMGANQSREETDQTVQAVAVEGNGTSSTQKSTGKLRRPSAPFNLAAARHTFTHASAAQRRIGGEKQVRADEYDFNPSPLKATPRFPHKDLKSLREISPTKKQKQVAAKAARVPTREESYEATQRQVDATVFGAERDADASNEDLGNLRRSRRQLEASKASVEAVAEEEEEMDEEAEEFAQHMQHLQDAMNDQIDKIANDVDEETVAQAQPRRSPRKPAPVVKSSVSPLPTQKNRIGIGSRPLAPTDDVQEGAPTSRAARIAEESRQEREARRARKQKIDERAAARKQEAQGRKGDHSPKPRSTGKPARLPKIRDSEAARKEAEDASLLSLEDSGQEAVVVDEEDADAGGEDEDEEDEVLVQPSTRRTKSAPKVAIDKARPSELFGRGTTANDLDASSPEKSPRKRKREFVESQRSASAANTSVKRQKKTPTDSSSGTVLLRHGEEDGPEAEGTSAPARRLYGQWRSLKILHNAIAEIGVWVKDGELQPPRCISLQDYAVKTVWELCEEYLEDGVTQPEAEVDLDDISYQVRSLYTTVDGEAPGLNNAVRCKNIYANLFPQLIKLLWRMVTGYEKTDAGSREPLTFEHLKNIRNFIRVIINLGIGAKDFKARPGSHLSIVQPVDSIIAKLKPIGKAFTKQLVRREREEHTRVQSQRAAEERGLAAQRAAVEAKQEERIKIARRKWKQLHVERLCAESGIVPRQKREHLRMPEPKVEYDQDGLPFERESVFHPRIGPPPADVEKARTLVWSNVHLAALAEGLAKYTGLDVYEKIFRQYCSRGGCLNGYNVTEILVCAAGLKEYLVDVAEQAGEEVRGWIRDIPVWTKGYPLGKENEDDGEEGVGGRQGVLEVVEEKDGDDL